MNPWKNENFGVLDALLLQPPADLEINPAEPDPNAFLDAWLGTDQWRTDGDRFLPLATDDTGGTWMLWWRPDLVDSPVVYFGENDSLGRVADSLDDWLEVLRSGRSPAPAPDADLEGWLKRLRRRSTPFYRAKAAIRTDGPRGALRIIDQSPGYTPTRDEHRQLADWALAIGRNSVAAMHARAVLEDGDDPGAQLILRRAEAAMKRANQAAK